MVDNNPEARWFWNDWDNDLGLRVCSFAAQGLWMRMLSIAARSEPRGFVAVNGSPLGPVEIAMLVGHAPEEVEPLVAELERNHVFSRDRKGRIYNRRMIRDEKRRKTAQKNGRNGGNPKLLRAYIQPTEIPSVNNGGITKQQPSTQPDCQPPSRAHPSLTPDPFKKEEENPPCGPPLGDQQTQDANHVGQMQQPASEAEDALRCNSGATFQTTSSRSARKQDDRGTRLSPDWEPSAELWQFAVDNGLDPEATFGEFRDYWRAVPGAKARKLDWEATARNHVRHQAERQRKVVPLSRAGRNSLLAFANGIQGD